LISLSFLLKKSHRALRWDAVLCRFVLALPACAWPLPLSATDRHQAVDVLRMNKGKAKRVVAADRLADDVGARDVQMIEKRVQIVAKDSRVAGRDSSVRKPESAEIQDEASIVPRQRRDLPPPAQVVAAAAMQEHDARTFAMFLIVKTSIGQLETRHSVSRNTGVSFRSS
jgi:hypothetical protein